MLRIPRKSYARYLLTSKWRYKRGQVLLERGPRCEICRNVSGAPDVHHLHYGSLGCEATEDLQILCRDCHEREHKVRPKYSFSSAKNLRKYLGTLPRIELNRRFPESWVAPAERLRRPKVSAVPPARVDKISPDGLSYTAKPKTRTDPDRFSVLSAAGFRCQYCGKSLSSYSFQVSNGKSSCGCDMLSEFLAKKSSLRALAP